MILPIFAYGQPVLRKVAEEIGPDYPNLGQLIENMWETMYHAHGVGLAAPQIGLSIRLFVVDTAQMAKEGTESGIKRIFINAQMLDESGEPWSYEEGCLSIPDIRGDVERQPDIRLKYLNEQFEEQEETFSGMEARVIQHEYDHIQGRLFIEHLKPLRKQMIKRRLEAIRKGNVEVDYKMKFAL